MGLALPAQAETLADALIAAYRNSNLLDQNRAVLRAADEGVAQAVASLRPTVTVGLGANWVRTQAPASLGIPGRVESLTGSLDLTAQLTVLDFGRGKLAKDAARESVMATREALVDVEQSVLLQAVQAYVNVKLSQEILALRQSNVRLITQELRAAQDRFEVGEITRTDVAIAEARLASARSSLAAAEGDLMVARETYKLAVGRYPGNLAPLPAAPRTARSLDEARGVALRTHPAIKQAQRESTLADINVARAKADMRPTVTARATMGLESGGDRTDSVGLSLNQTLYAGGRLNSLYRTALARRDGAKAALLQTTALVDQGLGNAWANLSVADASIQAGDLQVRSAQTAFEGVREEARLGARTTLDVLNAEQELLSARVTRVSAGAERYISVYALLSSMGLLTVDHLKLGIPTYDPEGYYNAVRNAPAMSAQGKKLDRILKTIGD
jgi:outer membrane protein